MTVTSDNGGDGNLAEATLTIVPVTSFSGETATHSGIATANGETVDQGGPGAPDFMAIPVLGTGALLALVVLLAALGVVGLRTRYW